MSDQHRPAACCPVTSEARPPCEVDAEAIGEGPDAWCAGQIKPWAELADIIQAALRTVPAPAAV
jgi:hypothetical protein